MRRRWGVYTGICAGGGEAYARGVQGTGGAQGRHRMRRRWGPEGGETYNPPPQNMYMARYEARQPKPALMLVQPLHDNVSITLNVDCD